MSQGKKIGVAGIGGIGHLAIKIATPKGAKVTAFKTSPTRVEDIKRFGAKEVVVVDYVSKLQPHYGTLD